MRKPRPFVAVALAVSMVITTLPSSVWAADDDTSSQSQPASRLVGNRPASSLPSRSIVSTVAARDRPELHQRKDVSRQEVQETAARFKAKFPHLAKKPWVLERVVNAGLRAGWTPTETSVNGKLPGRVRQQMLPRVIRAANVLPARDYVAAPDSSLTIWDWDDGNPDTWEHTVELLDPDGGYFVFNVQIAGDSYDAAGRVGRPGVCGGPNSRGRHGHQYHVRGGDPQSGVLGAASRGAKNRRRAVALGFHRSPADQHGRRRAGPIGHP